MTDAVQIALRKLPETYHRRPLTVGDAEAVTQLLTISDRVYNPTITHEAADLINDWATPGFDLGNSSIGVFDQDNQLLGCVEVWDMVNPPVHPWVVFIIHPNHEHTTEITSFLLEWMEQRAQQAVAKCPPEARVSYRTDHEVSQGTHAALFTAQGLKPIRAFQQMLIDLDSEPAPAVFPEDIHIRTYQHPADLELMFHAHDAAFRDHFGHMERPVEEALRIFRHDIENDQHFDPTLWFIAEDATGALAGYLMGRQRSHENPDVAYVMRLGVLREWRKRGIGEALLLHSFREFYLRGQRQAALHVDASSITGATRLYERAGMHIAQEWITYEKEIRPGIELSNTTSGDAGA